MHSKKQATPSQWLQVEGGNIYKQGKKGMVTSVSLSGSRYHFIG